MNLPNTPVDWAIKLTKILQAVEAAGGGKFYPVQIKDIACDLSKQFFPDTPLTLITGESFSDKFEGMLRPVPLATGQWGIIYNDAIKSRGRINFTLAHEFGHYLLHRATLENGIQCSREAMFDWDSEYGRREAEANQFASYLLMPRNLFENQLGTNPITLHLFKHIADYFEVSTTAAILKWLEFTNKRAMLVVAKDGFVDWCRCSENLLKSGVYLRPKESPIELPSQSLAAQKNTMFDNETGIHHKKNIWPFKEEVTEMTLIADTYEMTISLLLFDDKRPYEVLDEIDSEDTFTKFANG